MRQRNTLRNVVALGFASLCVTLILLRHHLRDLSEVARTYATFYPYLDQHPQVLFRYQADVAPHSSFGESDTGLVPQIIHQIFLTEGRDSSLAKYQPAIDSCQALHPNWEHNVWTDTRATEFMTQYYPHILPHYQGYKQSIQRANILRYALLDHFGGVYLDLDITCLRPLDELRHLSFITPGAYPAGVNNAFILSRPGHGFLKHLLDGVKSRDISWGMPYIENMLSTGCMFFSNRWMSYVRGLSDNISENQKVRILADATGDIDPHMLRGKVVTPLFEHGGASSWHGWDAAAIVMIGKHYLVFAFALMLTSVLAGLGIWKLISPSSRLARRRSWNTLLRRSMDKTEDREALAGWKQG